jgi:hypothetical protein
MISNLTIISFNFAPLLSNNHASTSSSLAAPPASPPPPGPTEADAGCMILDWAGEAAGLCTICTPEMDGLAATVDAAREGESGRLAAGRGTDGVGGVIVAALVVDLSSFPLEEKARESLELLRFDARLPNATDTRADPQPKISSLGRRAPDRRIAALERISSRSCSHRSSSFLRWRNDARQIDGRRMGALVPSLDRSVSDPSPVEHADDVLGQRRGGPGRGGGDAEEALHINRLEIRFGLVDELFVAISATVALDFLVRPSQDVPVPSI